MNACQRDSAFPESNLFGPNCWVRASTSAELRPSCALTCSAWRTRSALSACQARPSASVARPDGGAPAGPDGGAPVGVLTRPPLGRANPALGLPVLLASRHHR